jgi:hypothetical protein
MKRALRITLYVATCLLLIALIAAVNIFTMLPKLLDANPPKPGERVDRPGSL